MTIILHVEDDLTIASTVARLLKRTLPEVRVIHTLTVDAAITALGICQVQLVLSDYKVFGSKTGADLLEHVQAMRNPPPFVFLSSDERCADRSVPWLQKPASATAIRYAVLVAIDPPKVVVDIPFDDIAEVA